MDLVQFLAQIPQQYTLKQIKLQPPPPPPLRGSFFHTGGPLRIILDP